MKNSTKRNKAFLKAFAEGLRPTKDLTVSQYADQFVYMPSNVSDPGKFSLDRAPFQKEILDSLTPGNGINEVVWMAGAQTGKTFVSVVWQGYIFYIDPQNFIAYQPTETLAEGFVELKVEPFIEANAHLKEIFDSRKQKLTSKKFKGCTAKYLGAQSPNNFRMISAPYIFADEIDSYKQDLDGEGSPMKLLKARATTYGMKYKIFYSSTPTVKDASAVESKFLEGDQRYYHVPCPHCNAKQVLDFKHLIFKYKDDGDNKRAIPDSIYYECQVCKKEIKEQSKTWMLINGEWIPENPNAPKNIRSYHINSLYSPLGWYSWESMINDFLDAKEDVNALKAFKNTRLGETYYEKSEQPSHYKLMRRAEPYVLNTIEPKAVSLFAGVDVQDNRLCALIIAIGESCENWVVNYEEILGSPADQDTWKKLDIVLRREYEHKSGCLLKIKAAAIDTGGHFTNQVYDYCRKNQDLCFAVKGASHDISVYIKESTNKIDFDPKTGHKFANPLSLYLVNTMLLKKFIYISLNNMIANEKEEGSNVFHFSNELQKNFYEMLTSEKLIKKVVNGIIKEEFIKPKKTTRNEVLDCYVYAFAMAFMFQAHNLYGNEYKKVWENNIGKRVNIIEKKEQEVKQQAKPKKPITKPWINRQGFSIK